MAGRLIGDAYIVIYPQTDLFGPQAAKGIKEQLAALKPFVTVYPSLDKKGAATVKAQMEAVKPVVDVEPELDLASAAKIRAQLGALAGNMSIGAFLNPASMAKLNAEIQAAKNEEMLRVGIDPATLAAAKVSIDELLSHVDLGFRPDPAALAGLKKTVDAALNPVEEHFKLNPADLAAAKVSVNQLLSSAALLDVRINPATLAAVKAQADAFKLAQSQVPIDIPVQANIAPARTQLDELAANVSVLSTRLMNLRASVNDTAAEAKIAALQVRAAALASALEAAGSGANFAPFEAKLLGITAAMDKIIASEKAVEAETDKTTGVFQNLGLKGPGSLIHITDILNASIPEAKLFGGAIGMMYTALSDGDKKMPTVLSHLVNVATSAHLTAEAGIELLAIWAPAAIALTAFSAAAAPAVEAIYKQLVNMYTVSKATGQQWQSLAMQGQSVTAAVKPTVMEAFGIALYAAQQKSSGLAGAMHTLGVDIDQMAAKAAIAFDSKAGGQFFQTGASDANALMVSFEHLGSILGTLMKAVPGYAEVLLGFGNALLGVAAKGASFAEPVLAEFLKLHGALLYGGLTGTAAAWVFPKITEAAANAALGVGLAAEKILGSESKVVSAATGLGGALQGLSAGPVVAGVGLLAGAIAAVYLYLKVSKGAADNFNASIQKTISSASLGQLQTALTAGITQTTVHYTAAQKDLTTATNALSAAQAQQGGYTRAGALATSAQSDAVTKATITAQQYHGGLVQLTTQQTNVNSNLAALAKNFGLTGSASSQAAQALTLANGAQVQSNQLTSSGAANLQTMEVQMHGYVAQLAVMTAGTGTLNQALNALNVTQSAQVQDAQKLASAYSSWIGIVTSGQSAFITFEQGQQTLSSVLSEGTKSGAKLTVTVGKLKEQYPLVGAAMNGLTPAALGVQQAFLQQIGSATTLYGNLQTMATVSGNTAGSQVALAKAGKDLVAQLLPMAAGSQQATADVYALAQIVGFTGVDSFKSLATWLGNTKGAAVDLNKQQEILTLSSANLTQAAKDLSAAVGSEVTAAEAQAIAQTEGLSGKTLALADAFSKSQGAASASVTTLAGQYYSALIQAGTGATTAQGDVDAFLKQLGATQGVVDQVNAALASLPKQVNIAINVQVQEALSNQLAVGGQTNAIRNALAAGGFEAGGIVHAASGYTVRGSGPSGKDSQLIVAAPGELVIPTSHAAKYGTMAKRDGIPGFAGGGVPEPVFGSASRGGLPYSFASAVPEYGPASAAGTGAAGMPPMTSHQGSQIIQLLQTLAKQGAQAPYSYASALSQASASGVRRGYFASAG